MLSPSALLLLASLSQVPATPPTPPDAVEPPEAVAEEVRASDADDAADATRAATRAAEAAAEAAAAAAKATEKLAETADRIATALGAPPVVEASAPASKPQRWKGSVGVGVINLSGNANTLTVTLNGLVEYRTDDWVAQARANGAYGTSKDPTGGPSTVVAEAGALFLRGERRFSKVVSGYSQIGGETDHLASLELRTSAELGLGLTLLEQRVADKERLFLRTDLAVRYAYDYRYQYYPTRAPLEGVLLLAPSAGVTFRYQLNELVSLSQVADINPNVVGAARVVANSTTKLNTRLSTHFAFNVAFGVKYDSEPPEGKVSTDTMLTVGLEVTI
ncbi:MAG TPA: DUF481 domain-containing protein [Myxococcaceae bacterium]|nr:DUF481 domain-containing protein [Myxococcaceae bacterium]